MADPTFEVSLIKPAYRPQLMDRIGDDAFRYILLNTSLYLPVQNNCFMQLSGEPVYERYQHRPSPPVAGIITRVSTGRRKKKSELGNGEPAIQLGTKKAVKSR